jgi:hypothetical protein
LEFLNKAVTEENAYFAKQVRDILKEVCASGAADRKKKVAPGKPNATDLTEESGI